MVAVGRVNPVERGKPEAVPAARDAKVIECIVVDEAQHDVTHRREQEQTGDGQAQNPEKERDDSGFTRRHR